MANDYTPEQKEAIECRGCSVLVSAGAGSGKTRVLTERLIRYITDPGSETDIDDFLIITYTKAAAAELRGRILTAIAEKQQEDPANRRLRRQSALVGRAQIGTIHSFCSSIIRENCHTVGISPDFRVLDDDRAETMKISALDRTLDEFYASPDDHPGFLLLADTIGSGRDDSDLEKLVRSLHEKMQSHDRPEAWAKGVISELDNDISDVAESLWGKYLTKDAKSKAEYLIRELTAASEAFLDAIDAGKPEEVKKCGMLTSVNDMLTRVTEFRDALASGWDAARGYMPIKMGSAAGGRPKVIDKYSYEKGKAIRDDCSKQAEKLNKMFAQDSQQLITAMKLTTPAMKALLELTLAFDRRFAADKQRNSVLDYSDLEHFAVKLLLEEDGVTATAAAKAISERFTEIMVDEYQDVSRVQESIFNAIAKHTEISGKDVASNLFMVGDVKQAIYRFRLANPHIFTGKRDYFNTFDRSVPGSPRVILLRENFRSRKEVLDAANCVFSCCMSKETGDTDYRDKEELICGSKAYPDTVPVPEVLLLRLPGKDEDNDGTRKSLEAEMVARRIRELVDSGTEIIDGKVRRPLEYRDIAILMRSANKNAEIYRKALVKYNIPVSCGSGDYFETVEIAAVCSLLKIIDNPNQDIPLLTALTSPAYGLSPDTLSFIRASRKRVPLYMALREAAENSEECRKVFESINTFRAEAPDMTAPELVWTIINRLDLMAIFSAMSDGSTRRANLLELVTLAEQFEESGYNGLHRFVLWLGRVADGKNKNIGAGAENTSAVQIVTIHKSKGLEYPVVFISNASAPFNRSDTDGKVLVDSDLGLGPRVYDNEKHINYPTLARNAIAAKTAHDNMSEELRVLYVAMTRPKERLFITGSFAKPEETLDKIEMSLDRLGMHSEAAASVSSPIQWVLYAALADDRKRINITVVEPETEEEAASLTGAASQPDDMFRREIEDRLSFAYPFAAAEELPSKITATELKGDREDTDEEAAPILPKHKNTFRSPDFLRASRPATGAERGTAAHHVLQFMDFSKSDSVEAVKEEIARLAAEGYIPEREAECVDPEMITGLFRSDIGRRMLNNPTLRREFKFSLLTDVSEIFGADTGDKVLLQGVVDCFMEEDGEVVIIDYKTDAVRTPEEIEERTQFYSGQVRAYARALERILKKPVKEGVLYFLRPGVCKSVKI